MATESMESRRIASTTDQRGSSFRQSTRPPPIHVAAASTLDPSFMPNTPQASSPSQAVTKGIVGASGIKLGSLSGGHSLSGPLSAPTLSTAGRQGNWPVMLEEHRSAMAAAGLDSPVRRPRPGTENSSRDGPRPPAAGMRGALSWGVGPNAYEVDGRPGTRGSGPTYDIEGRPLSRSGRPSSNQASVQSPVRSVGNQKHSIGSSGVGLSWPTPDPPGSGSSSPLPGGRGGNRKAQSSGGVTGRQASSSDLGMSPPRGAKRSGGPAGGSPGAAAKGSASAGGAAVRNGGRRASVSDEIDQLLHGELSDEEEPMDDELNRFLGSVDLTDLRTEATSPQPRRDASRSGASGRQVPASSSSLPLSSPSRAGHHQRSQSGGHPVRQTASSSSVRPASRLGGGSSGFSGSELPSPKPGLKSLRQSSELADLGAIAGPNSPRPGSRLVASRNSPEGPQSASGPPSPAGALASRRSVDTLGGTGGLQGSAPGMGPRSGGSFSRRALKTEPQDIF